MPYAICRRENGLEVAGVMATLGVFPDGDPSQLSIGLTIRDLGRDANPHFTDEHEVQYCCTWYQNILRLSNTSQNR